MHPAGENRDRDRTLRLFLALSVPEEVKAQLHRVQLELRETVKEGARWTPPDQFHLTLKFLGGVRHSQVEPLLGALSESSAPFGPLVLTASGLGAFPPRGKPRVLWAGVSDAAQQLPLLQRAVELASAAFTAEPPVNDFSGHITLARLSQFRGAANELKTVLAGSGQRMFGGWTANHLALMQSELSSAGATHLLVAEIPLKRG
ncbi:MAG TPA: RNA 2',3'-cyclic phosphodiesterase [Methylomirabilota bacterium]|jgi:2'-5' RNA ligase|nr:RNA 2',3'-cyclic phosphodiesterase [Methylomirabilota bacterium]